MPSEILDKLQNAMQGLDTVVEQSHQLNLKTRLLKMEVFGQLEKKQGTDDVTELKKGDDNVWTTTKERGPQKLLKS